MTFTRAMILTVSAALASAGVLSAVEAAQGGKGKHHQPRRHVAQSAAPSKGSAQYGNNTRDNNYGGVYGEYSFKGD